MAALRSLTCNPDRKNLPPNGRINRGSLILLCLLLSGDVEINPGPVYTRRMARKAMEKEQQQMASTKPDESPSGTSTDFTNSCSPLSVPQPSHRQPTTAAVPLTNGAHREDPPGEVTGRGEDHGGDAATSSEVSAGGGADRADDPTATAEGTAGCGEDHGGDATTTAEETTGGGPAQTTRRRPRKGPLDTALPSAMSLGHPGLPPLFSPQPAYQTPRLFRPAKAQP